LNLIICKDRYPLFFVNKTLAQLSEITVFIKLNIHSTFNRIRPGRSLHMRSSQTAGVLLRKLVELED